VLKENRDGEVGELGMAGREASECMGPGIGELESPAADTKAARRLSFGVAWVGVSNWGPELILETEGGEGAGRGNWKANGLNGLGIVPCCSWKLRVSP
jgi:hypothetical protein